jgi:hypothetical protein
MEKYELEQTLQPDEQMWIDVGKLIREHVPDKNGKTLPADVTSGSFEVRDLTDIAIGSLFEGKITYDKTYGHVAYGCARCCTYSGIGMDFNPLGIPFQGSSQNGVSAWESCANRFVSVSFGFSNGWSTINTAIATVNGTGLHTGHSVGSTGTQAFGRLVTQRAVNCPASDVLASGGANVTKLSCTSSVARGGTATCTVTPTGVAVSNWKFTDSSNNTVTRSTNTGTLVTGGTISVSANSIPLSANINVTNRNWHTNPASPAEVANGTILTLPVPPAQSGSDSGLGAGAYQLTDTGFSITTIGDSGPNSGYSYYASVLVFSSSYFHYEINPDLENSNSTFSQHQSGTNGFISWSNLLAQTNRHEWNSATQSHYAFYSNGLSSNNPGDYFESRVAAPSTNLTTFNADTRSGINSRYNTITADTSVEPYPVNYSETGTPLGNVCYSPYTACP